MSISSRIEYVPAEELLDDAVPTAPAPRRTFAPPRRAIAGGTLSCVALPLVTLALDASRGSLSLEGEVLVYLLAVVVIALVGGIAVALACATVAALLINYYFVAPLHTFDVARTDQAVALGVFVAVAGLVSGAVEVAGRRAQTARRASEQAETLSTLAGAGLGEREALRTILERARATFRMDNVVLKLQTGEEWEVVDSVGWTPDGHEAPLRFDVPAGHVRLIGRGPALFAEDQRVLNAFAAAADTAYTAQPLSERAREASALAAIVRQRTALLAAVGHDLRTPLAGIKASVSSLRQPDIVWSDADRDVLLATIEESTDRLDAVVANLLDASRLEAGALSVSAEPIALDEAVGAALLAVPDAWEGRVTVRVGEDLPLVSADPGLLERVLVNLIDNAVRHGGEGAPVEITAFAGARTAKLEVADHGPGVPADERERIFEPFRRLDDRHPGSGVGLGLFVARGFAEAMGGALVADRAPDGGLLMRMRLPLADGKDGAR
jgi:two-component system sensor histidine kinase KdpD